jgi:hypothetical protein
MNQALESLNLTRLWAIYPGEDSYPLSKQISVWSMKEIVTLPKQVRKAWHGRVFHLPVSRSVPRPARRTPRPASAGPRGTDGCSRQHVVRHAIFLPRAKQGVRVQGEAVISLDVAHRPDGLGQDVEAGSELLRMVANVCGFSRHREPFSRYTVPTTALSPRSPHVNVGPPRRATRKMIGGVSDKRRGSLGGSPQLPLKSSRGALAWDGLFEPGFSLASPSHTLGCFPGR